MPVDHSITVERIQKHYDRLSPLYRLLWGEHIHHGYWERSSTARQAQLALVERLAAEAEICLGSHVLDVGCGLGGSAIWLATELQCSVLGLTISQVQLEIARRRAREKDVADRV